MENNRDNESKITNNVNSVVDEILGIKTSNEPVVEEVDVSESTPPPIPGQEISTPPPIPGQDSASNDDFIKQVMNVVDNDIDAKPVDLSSIDEMIREEKKLENNNDNKETVIISDGPRQMIPTKPISQSNRPIEPEKSVVETKEVEYIRPNEGIFFREDEIKLENYQHNIRIDRGDIFELDRIQNEMNKKNIELINQKYQTIIEAKEKNINDLIDKNRELEQKANDDQFDYSKRIEEIYQKENQQLREVKSNFSDLLAQKERLEKTLYDFQLKELQNEQDKILAEKDAIILERKRLEEERLKKEEEIRLENERKEKERQEQLQLEKLRIEREALEKQQKVIEELLEEQKKLKEKEAKASASPLLKRTSGAPAARKEQIVSLSEAKKLGNMTRKNSMPTRR